MFVSQCFIFVKIYLLGDAWVAQQLSICLCFFFVFVFFEQLTLAQDVITQSQDGVPHQAPCDVLLPLPVSLPLCVCVSHEQINEIFEKKTKQKT